jgi:hypothetical protein
MAQVLGCNSMSSYTLRLDGELASALRQIDGGGVEKVGVVTDVTWQ